MLVAHGTRTFAEDGPNHMDPHSLIPCVHELVSNLTGVPVERVSELALHSKVIDWHVSQMVKPVEAIITSTEPVHSVLEAQPKGTGTPHLVIAGDFLTQSSFVGCVGTAIDAANATISSLKQN